ncbi:hypothetical protein CN505_08960 [Bacillus cereus]|nr:hypothetical protein ICG_00317 [Bacillus cereus BAG1X1-3]EOO70755.1 hypothetical protein IC7_04558 [Bacillus cereus BAG1O-1]PES84644.1 hypothetical protein CN509_01720 [Bacillus cereus]PET06863.1 hypothetical protein CN505_08960 [Bacillus cereus]PEU05553.1 hypothetical protein CN527_01065 [Bacillus cereus]
MRKILIVPKSQYGYNTDYFKMINYLAEQNVEVDVLCLDQGFQKISSPQNVKVNYIKQKGKGLNYINYNFEIIKSIIKGRKNYNWIIISGTIEYCGNIPLLLKKLTQKTVWIMDIRTCSVLENEKKRTRYDKVMKWSAKFFNHVTIISGLVAERLKIDSYTLLPLGANKIVDVTQKKLRKEKINFLYVGTFENRNIENIIKAYDIFHSKVRGSIKTRFDIVGFSNTNKTQQSILKAIESVKNPTGIIFHGRKQHDEIIHLFEEASVGFSYVPITDYYDVQPPTKTYEYIINGIMCIGTNTKANAQIINENNGILVNDDIDSLVNAMEDISKEIFKYNTSNISKTVQDYEWDKIESRFYKFLNEINLKKI